MNCTTESGTTYPVDAPVTQFWSQLQEQVSAKFSAYWTEIDELGSETEMLSPIFNTLIEVRDYLIADGVSPQSVIFSITWFDQDGEDFDSIEFISPNPFA